MREGKNREREESMRERGRDGGREKGVGRDMILLVFLKQ